MRPQVIHHRTGIPETCVVQVAQVSRVTDERLAGDHREAGVLGQSRAVRATDLRRDHLRRLLVFERRRASQERALWASIGQPGQDTAQAGVRQQ